MKKLLLFLLIFALFLMGCSTPAPAEGGNETPDAQQNGSDASAPTIDQNNDSNDPNQSHEKVPVTQITNEGKPQDESADFLFVFKGRNGYFARGERIELDVELINNMENSFIWQGSSSEFRADVKLVHKTNGEEYIIQPMELPMNNDIINGEIKPGESDIHSQYFDIPADAPLGEYTLVCQYRTTITEFEGYFTLTQ